MTKEINSSNQLLVVNMASRFLSLVVTFGISFFLSPYIVETVGVEAYTALLGLQIVLSATLR